MKQLRQYKGQLLFTLVLLIMLLAAPFQDYVERNFTYEDMNYPEDAIGIVSTEQDMLTVPEDAGAITLTSNDYYFKKGSYQLTFAVTSQEEGSKVQVYDPLYLNGDNTPGRILSEVPVEPGQETVSLSFTVEDPVSCVEFRVQAAGALTFRGIYLLSERGLYRDPQLLAALLLLASALLLLYRTRKPLRAEVLIPLAFAAVWASMPLTLPWLLRGHDMFFHYSRMFYLAQDLFTGQFPVRIHSGLFRGFGYMNPVFYPELFLYPFALLCRLGMSPIGCYRLLLLSVNLVTAGISYYAFSRLLRSRKTGMTAAFFYTLSAYRLINLYTRSAVGEVLATMFLPLLLLGMYQLFYGNDKKWITAVLAFTGLFQSHMISTELALGYALLFALLSLPCLKDRQRLIHILIAGGTTMLLNLWSILPLLDLMRYPLVLQGDARNLAGYSLYGVQLFDTGLLNPAGDALGRGSIAGEMPYSLGLLLLLGSLLFLSLCLRKRNRLPAFQLRLGVWCLIFGSLSVYASTIYFPWERLQRLSFLNHLVGAIQFSSRFLPFATLFLCVVSAIAVCGYFREPAAQKLLFLGCALFLTCSAGNYFSRYVNEAATFASVENQLDSVQTTDVLYLISHEGDYFSTRELTSQEVTFTASDGVTLTDTGRKGSQAVFTYEKAEGSAAYVDVPFNYYPYYRASDTEGRLLTTAVSDQLIRLRVLLPEAASGTVTVTFRLPALYRAGDLISLLTALGLAALALIPMLRKKKE